MNRILETDFKNCLYSLIKMVVLISLLTLAAQTVIGPGKVMASSGAASYSISLDLIGDVEEPVKLENIFDFQGLETIEHQGQEIEVIPLKSIIEKAKPWTDQYNIYCQAVDGFAVEISGERLEESYLTWNQTNGWEAINFQHPVSSNIKDIEKLVIIAEDASLDDSFNLIEPGRNLVSLTPGQVIKAGLNQGRIIRGSSAIEVDSTELKVTTYYNKEFLDLDKYYNFNNRSDNALVIGQEGEVIDFRQDGRFSVNKNTISYLEGDDVEIDEVAGVVFDPPKRMITDIYSEIRNFLAKDEKVLVSLVDGFGHHQYELTKAEGYIPFLASLPEPELTMSAYPSVSPVNLAASLTGELPHRNGIYERGIRQSELPTIFADYQEADKSAAAIIGPMGTIEFEIMPYFSLDQNNDGSTDDEKTERALEELKKDHELVFVHYKDIDSYGHTYGPMAAETLDQISKIESYLKELVERWDGQVIIYSDHGMHDLENSNGNKLGDHGSLRTEDMFTPSWIFDGGEINE